MIRQLMLQQRKVSTVVLLLLCFLLPLFCYLTTLVQVHTFDALSYVLDVDRKPWQELFHPHHLAYGPLGALVAAIARALGWSEGSLLPMQVTNALAGAAGVALFAALVRHVTQRIDLALCGALLLWGSYAYWYYAIEVEVYTIAALFLILALWLLVRVLKQPDPRLGIWLGLAQGCAVLFHQTNLLFCLPVGVALLVSRGSRTERMQVAVRYLAALTCVVVGAYALVGLVIGDFDSVAEFAEWLTAYASTGWWGGPVTSEKWASLGAGLADTLAQPGGALLGLLLFGLLLLYGWRLWQAHAHLALCLLVWLGTYGAFFLWWEPENIEFWIASLPPALLLLLLALRSGGPAWHAGVWVALGVGVTTLTINYGAVIERGSGAQTPQRHIASLLAQQSLPDDLVLVADGLQELYLLYYEEQLNVFSLNYALFDSGGDWSAACARVQGEIEAALARGSAVLVGDAVLQPALAETQFIDPLEERFQITQYEVGECLAAYISGMQVVELGAGLPAYYRLPSTQELAQGPGWDFTHHRWGWWAANISDEQFGAGWDMVPGIDPHMTSPPVAIEAEHFCALDVRMAKATENQKLEVFFVDERGLMDSEYSMRWRLTQRSTAKTYRLPLRERPGWSGIITGLRLDPVGVGDGERVRLESVRLVPEGEC